MSNEHKCESLTDLPAHLKNLAIFINRVGFQMFAFIAMLGLCGFIFWFGTQSLDKITNALDHVTGAVAENTVATREIKTWITDNHRITKEIIRSIRDESEDNKAESKAELDEIRTHLRKMRK